MEQFIYGKSWYGRKILVKKLDKDNNNSVLAGYIELLNSDPKGWLRHAAVGDVGYFSDIYPFDNFIGQLFFAGYLYDKKHLFIGFDTRKVDKLVSKDECIESLKKAARSLS